MNNFEDL